MKHPSKDKFGQSVVEYILAFLLLAVVIVIALVLTGPALGDFLAEQISFLSSQ